MQNHSAHRNLASPKDCCSYLGICDIWPLWDYLTGIFTLVGPLCAYVLVLALATLSVLMSTSNAWFVRTVPYPQSEVHRFPQHSLFSPAPNAPRFGVSPRKVGPRRRACSTCPLDGQPHIREVLNDCQRRVGIAVHRWAFSCKIDVCSSAPSPLRSSRDSGTQIGGKTWRGTRWTG